MFKLIDYFENKSCRTYPEFDSEPLHKSTVKDFYEDFIRNHFQKIFVENRSNFLKWCEILEAYINSDIPIFWIRKFESGSGKANTNDNRRTGTTVLVDENKKAIAAFVYVSNFDAQELYNAVLNVEPCDKSEFETLILSGNYQFHYDNGRDSTETAITSFKCLEHANSFGVFNRARLYLAHIADVNGEYNVKEYQFCPGKIEDWKPLSDYSGYDFANIFSADCGKKVRVLEYNDDVSDLKKFLKAHFFRFVHPFNYYLVPGQNYEINAVFGKTKKSIGECKNLTDYVKYRMFVDFIQNDADLLRHYKFFEETVLIDNDKSITRNFDKVKAESEKLQFCHIHAVYGTTVGKEGQLLEKLSKNIVNVDKAYDIYKNYTYGDTFVLYDLSSCAETCRIKPTSIISTVIDMLEKISGKISKVSSTTLEIRLEKPTVAHGTKAMPKAATAPKAKSGAPKKKIPSKPRAKIDEFTDFMAYLNYKSTATSYKSSISSIMKELGIPYLSDLSSRIDNAINYCTNKLTAATDKKELKKYKDIRAALRKYKEFLNSKSSSVI